MSDKIEGEGMERRQVVMLAALGAILLALIYFMFLRGGTPEEETQPVAAPPPIAQAESEDPFEPEPEADGDASTQPVETFEVFASRDPFEPVIENGSQGEGVDAPSDNGTVEDPNEQGQQDPTDPEDNEETEDPEDPEEEDPGAQANEQDVEGRSVSLIDVYREGKKDLAQVQVDSTGYTVAVGEVFAENFQLVSTSGQCATLLYGDDQFTLCEGDEILK